MERFVRTVRGLLNGEETPDMYYHGGLHPVYLGDRFKNGRYRVVHKLGFGEGCTVWLVRDTKADEWATLKIFAADRSISERARRDLAMVRAVQAEGHCHFVSTACEEFSHIGPNGSHLCIVTELLGPSLKHFIANLCADVRPEPDTIMMMSGRLLEAAGLLHQAGFAHGNLSGENVVFTARNLASLSGRALFDIIGWPEIKEVLNDDGSPLGPHLPTYLVGAASWSNWHYELEEDICFINFGESFRFEDPPRFLAQPFELQVPETLFDPVFDYRVDLWRLGCMIYALVFLRYPFRTLEDMVLEDDTLLDDTSLPHILLAAEMIDFVECLPPEWVESWQRLKDGRSIPDAPISEPRLLTKFRNEVPEPQLAPLLRVIEGLMRLLPAERKSALAALDLLPIEISDDEVA